MKFSSGFALAFVALGVAMGITGMTRPLMGQQTAGPQPVIIDSDIGDDIDDAYALALALRSPELKILGVTTTFGNTELRARLVDRYLQAVGRTDIPVAAGPESKTDNVLTQRAYALQAPASVHADGVEFLLDQARKHPGEITL